MLEIFYIKFLYKVLKLKPSTSNCMVYGGVGKLPLHIFVDKKLISYWLRILDKDKNALAYITYMIVLNPFMRNEYHGQYWLIRVNHILNNYGLSYMWLNQQTLQTMDPEQNSAYHRITPHQRIGRLSTWKVMYKSTVESDSTHRRWLPGMKDHGNRFCGPVSGI